MSKDNITNYGKSIRSKLLNVAKKEDVFLPDSPYPLFSGAPVVQNVADEVSR
jgi:hypothetical protein